MKKVCQIHETPIKQIGGGYLLKTDGYDPFIDFIKGVCILFVLLQHSVSENVLDKVLFCLWGNQAVPLFFIIQSFHSFKKGVDQVTISWSKLWKRIIKPFCLVLVALFILTVLIPACKGSPFLDKFYTFIMYVGPAPGSYYVWVYIQMSVIIWFCSRIMGKMNDNSIFAFFLLLSVLLEFLCSLVTFHPLWYRVLFFRYFFLIYIGYSLCKKLRLDASLYVAGLISIIAILLFRYSSYSFSPFFVSTEWGFSTNHWICYPYCIVLILLLRKVFELNVLSKPNELILLFGKYSYQIYLWQMLYFILPFRSIMNKIWGTGLLSSIIYVVICLMVCTLPIVLYKEKINFLKRKSF